MISIGGIRGSRWTILALALAVQIATSALAAALPVLLPLLRADYHLSYAGVGLLANLPFVGSLLTLAIAGWAVDMFGDRVVLLLSATVAGLAAVVCAVAPNFAVLVVGLLAMGIGIGMGTPAGSVAVRTAFPAGLRATVMGLRQTGMPLGSFVAAIVAPSIAVVAGWRGALAAGAALALIVTLSGLLLCWNVLWAARPSTERASGLVLSRNLARVGTSGLFLVAAQSCLLTYVVTYLVHDRNLSIAIAGIYLGLAQLFGAGGRILWGVVSDRLFIGNRRAAVLCAVAVGAIGSSIMAAIEPAAPIAILIAAILICATGAIGWNGVQISLLAELAPGGGEGRGVGLGLMFQQPGAIAGPFLFGAVVDGSGSFRLAWLLVTLFLVIAGVVMAGAREPGSLTSRQPAASRVS